MGRTSKNEIDSQKILREFGNHLKSLVDRGYEPSHISLAGLAFYLMSIYKFGPDFEVCDETIKKFADKAKKDVMEERCQKNAQ